MNEVREQCGIEVNAVETRRKRHYDGDSIERSRRSTSTNDTDGSGEEDTSRVSGTSNDTNSRTQSRSTTGDTTGDSASSRMVLDEFDDTLETIPAALVDDLFELDGALQYSMSYFNPLCTV